jgi:Ca2+:H+ antiporter
MRRTWILSVLVAGVTFATGIAHFAEAPSLLTFGIATLALAGLAWIVAFATEQVGQRFGPAVTGLLQSTLGNLPEFFIVVFALSAGEVVVARASILGSIFANALFVLGLVIVAGSVESNDGVMRFHARLPKDNATLLLLASFLIVVLGISVSTGDKASHHITAISVVGSVALLVTYAVWLSDYLRSDTPVDEQEARGPAIPLWLALAFLAAAGVGAALVADWFIDALSPAMEQVGIPKAFAGLVIVAIAGNAVENTTGIVLALRGDATSRSPSSRTPSRKSRRFCSRRSCSSHSCSRRR